MAPAEKLKVGVPWNPPTASCNVSESLNDATGDSAPEISAVYDTGPVTTGTASALSLRRLLGRKVAENGNVPVSAVRDVKMNDTDPAVEMGSHVQDHKADFAVDDVVSYTSTVKAAFGSDRRTVEGTVNVTLSPIASPFGPMRVVVVVPPTVLVPPNKMGTELLSTDAGPKEI